MEDHEAQHLVADACTALTTRFKVDDLLAAASQERGVPVLSLQRLADLVNEGEIDRAAQALQRVRKTGTCDEGGQPCAG